MDDEREGRLDAIRQEAEERGVVDAAGIRAVGGPLPPRESYYSLPLLKPPVWTWEIPLYFFVGGTAGVSAVIGVTAQLARRDPKLVRDARRLAAAGALLSGPLLVSDLGRPARFLNMLRVFKPQSPMSVGAWTLALFSATAVGALHPNRMIRGTAALFSALSGLGMATYTGVLLGATAVPVWAHHAGSLPIHFAASSLGSCVSMLELAGHRQGALHRLGLIAAGVETAMAVEVERRREAVTLPLRSKATGVTARAASLFSGPIPFLLRAIGTPRTRRAAAASAIVGSLLTRIAWVEAGRASAQAPAAGLR